MFFNLFEDDTNIFYSHNSLDTLFELMNTEYKTYCKRFCAYKLPGVTLNIDKIDHILFKSHRKRCPSECPKLCINGA